MTASSSLDRVKLPEHPRRLLKGLFGLSNEWLESAFQQAVKAFEQHIFHAADIADNSQRQQRCFDALRELKTHRNHFWPAFRQQFERSVAELPDRAINPVAEAKKRAPGRLTMMESSEMDESLGLDEISTRAEMRHSQMLYLFGMRLGVLAGTPALAPESNPFAPRNLSHCARTGALTLNLPTEFRMELYKLIDRLVYGLLDEHYEALNGYLISNNVLPHMEYVTPRMKPASRPARAAPAAKPESEEDQTESAEETESAEQLAYSEEQAEPQQPQTAQRSPIRDSGQLAPVADIPGDELFETLRTLIAERRTSNSPPAVPPEKAHAVSAQDVQAVLGMLQGRAQPPIMVDGKPVRRTVAHLRQDLLNHLKPLVPDGKLPALNAVDSDSLELVGLLFDSVLKQSSSSTTTQDLLHRLQAPVARLALTDRQFFSHHDHPARRLMNLIAEAGLRWVDDTDADQGFIERMRSMVDHVVRDFDGNNEIFEQSASDLEQQLGVLKRKADVSERRHVDAARGREKLDLAREHSQQAIQKCMEGHKPSRLLRTLLEQAWTDVLALTMLRVGEDDPAVSDLLAIARKLLAADQGEGSRLPSDLRKAIESGLTNVGYHNADVTAICTRLFEPEKAADDDSIATSTELAVRLKSRARLGQDGKAKTKSRDIDPPLNASELTQFGQLRKLPFGTWFDFRMNQQGHTVRRKLSWYSTVTLNCLFVNTRGVKALETSLQQLARDLTRGQVALVEEESGGLIDRAWNSILRTLRGIGGRNHVET